MPRKIYSKSSFLFTSMVASAALAPILTSQINFEDKDSLSPKQMSNSSSAQTSLVNQGLFQLNLQKKTFSTENEDHSSEQYLTATSHKQRESNVVNLVIAKEATHIDLSSLYQKEEDLLERIKSIWPEDTVLTRGDSGEKIGTIQQLLSEIGYYVDDIDGKFGQKTYQAIRLYQKKHGLKIDGIVGNETITHLLGTKHLSVHDLKENDLNANQAKLAKIYKPENLSIENVYIHDDFIIEKVAETKSSFEFGDQSEDIASLQEQLKESGYYSHAVDGIYGRGTEQAVRALQRDHALLVDGIAGQQVTSFLASSNLQELAKKRKEIIVAEQMRNLKQVSPPSTASDASLTSVETIISSANELLGIPYLWGGTTPHGFDCSGFLVYIYGKLDKNIPRTVIDIWRAATPSSSLNRGDIVFFETYEPGPSHLGIYLGNGSFIHSGSSKGVSIASMNSPYWSQRYLGARSL